MVHSSRKNGYPRQGVAAFGWISSELMGHFISGIAGSVKTLESNEGEYARDMSACFLRPGGVDRPSAKTEGTHMSKQHNRFGYEEM